MTHSGINKGYVMDVSQFPSDAVTGYTGNSGDVLQIKVPTSYANRTFTLKVFGKDTRTEAAMFYYEPNTSGEQRVLAYSTDVSGVSFLLESSTDGGSWTAVDTKTTDSTGKVKFPDLNAATNIQYRLTETKTISGQALQAKPIYTGTLSKNRDLTFTVCNTGVTALPFTGSSGFLFIPMALLMLSTTALILHRKKSRAKS